MKNKVLALILSVATAASCLFAFSVDSNAGNVVDTGMVSQSSSSALIVGSDIVYTANFKSKPSSDDGKVYLYELKTYEYGLPEGATPVGSAPAGTSVSISIPLNYTEGYCRLYNKFVLGVKRGGTITLIDNAQYITNPEVLALNPKARVDRPVKAFQYGNVLTQDLTGGGAATNKPSGGLHMVFVNDDPNSVTADPRTRMADAHPVRKNPVTTYAFNTSTDEGIAGIIADVSYHAANGNAQDFVIGNEVNERCWNYMAWVDWDTYLRNYVEAFRICYTAIKSQNPNARVYISLDQVWDKTYKGDDYYEAMNGKEFLAKFNSMIKQNGNLDWDMSIHPYPNPLYWAKFWDPSSVANGATAKAQVQNNQVITFENLSVLTNVLQSKDYLNRSGQVRDVIIGEIGIGSNAGVENQAACVCASYAAFERNPYVTQYLYLEYDVNGFFPTLSGKALEAYNAMGTADEEQYMSWAKQHIGITDWSQVLR